LKNETLGQPSDDHLTPEFAAKGTTPATLVRAPTNEEYDLKRPKAGGIAFPFSIQGHKATASMTTLTSEIGVPPIDDVRTKGVMRSGVTENAADIHAANGTESSTEEAKAMRQNEQSVIGIAISEKGKGKQNEMSTNSADGEKAVENGQVVSAERPPLETFVTAASSFPTL
jgi:hypothetical protein